MLSVLIFGHFTSLALAVSNGSSSCDPKILSKCYSTFLSSFLNFTTLPSYDLYQTAKIQNLISKGFEGQKNLCNQQNALQRCLGANSSCINTVFFKLAFNQSSRSDADKYQTDFRVEQYMCGPGFNVVIDNFPCLNAILKNNLTLINVCEKQLKTDMTKDFKCGYFNDFMNCMHNIYVYECGWKVSKFICETTKVAVRAKTEKCDKSLVKCVDSPIAFVDLGSSTRVSSPKTTSTKVTLASNTPKSSLKLTSSVARTKSLKLQLTTV